MRTSRRKVFDFIVSQRAVTARDISQAFDMTPANARHHLAILQDQGSVEIIGQRPSIGKGRPAQLFGLARYKSENNLGKLASILLDELEDSMPSHAYQHTLQRIAKRMQLKLSTSSLSVSAHLTQRLYQVIQVLNTSNYQARWEAHISAPHLILGHCPYKSILNHHPVMCQLDTLLLESMLEEPVEQIAKLEPDSRGLPICVFQIGRNQ